MHEEDPAVRQWCREHPMPDHLIERVRWRSEFGRWLLREMARYSPGSQPYLRLQYELTTQLHGIVVKADHYRDLAEEPRRRGRLRHW